MQGSGNFDQCEGAAGMRGAAQVGGAIFGHNDIDVEARTSERK